MPNTSGSFQPGHQEPFNVYGTGSLFDVKGIETLPDGASPYGVHDMSDNARKWVQDWYAKEYYRAAPDRNPKGPETGLLKVIRGGSWHSFKSDIRAAARGKGGFALKTHGTGFRCAKDVSAAPRPVAEGDR